VRTTRVYFKTTLNHSTLSGFPLRLQREIKFTLEAQRKAGGSKATRVLLPHSLTRKRLAIRINAARSELRGASCWYIVAHSLVS
jgi:hypothetical protein